MKISIISSVVLTTLLVASLFQPHQHISAAPQNITDQGANGCIGLHCLIAVDDEADFLMDQRATRPSRMLANAFNYNIAKTKDANKQSPDCGVMGLNGQTTCLGSKQLVNKQGRPCDPTNRVYPYCTA